MSTEPLFNTSTDDFLDSSDICSSKLNSKLNLFIVIPNSFTALIASISGFF